MRTIRLHVGKAPLDIQVRGIRCGEDLSLLICGGKTFHIGAVSLAEYDPQRAIATVSTIARHGHRDSVFAQLVATALSKRLKSTVSVSVGVHADELSREDAQKLQQNILRAVAALLDYFSK